MRKNTAVIEVLTMLLVTLNAMSLASDRDDARTFGLQNGRFWNALPEGDTRTMFVIGILDGWKLREQTEELVSGKVIMALSGCGPVTYSELSDMVTAAYSQPENRALPVGWVLMADIAIQCGRTSQEAVFPALRRHLAAVSVGKHEGAEISPIDAILAVSVKQKTPPVSQK